MNGHEVNNTEEGPTGPVVFVKAGLAGLLKALLVLFLAWVCWKGYENQPMEQVKELLKQQPK